MDYCVITFTSTHGAIQAQKCLQDQVPVVIMPVLREISKGCGISVRFEPADLDKVRELMTASPLTEGEYAYYSITGRGADLRAEPLAG